MRALGAPWSQRPEAELAGAAASAEGSVREALRLLDGDGVVFDAALRAMFARLPQVDWLAVHALADRLTGRENESAYETFMRALIGFLDAPCAAGEGAGRLSPTPAPASESTRRRGIRRCSISTKGR